MTIKTISMSAKCSDMCSISLLDENDKEVFESHGYVPDFFPDDHFGDYVMLDIDVETGVIKNWKKPSQADINKWMHEEGKKE